MEIFVRLFSETVRPTKLKLGTRMDNGLLHRAYQNQVSAIYLSPYLFVFFFFPVFKH